MQAWLLLPTFKILSAACAYRVITFGVLKSLPRKNLYRKKDNGHRKFAIPNLLKPKFPLLMVSYHDLIFVKREKIQTCIHTSFSINILDGERNRGRVGRGFSSLLIKIKNKSFHPEFLL